MSHPTPILAVGIPGLYPHICYGHNLESCADIGSIYGDYIYIYIPIWWLDHCLIISSDILIWFPTLFILYGSIYIYIHKYIYTYIYIYTYGELYIFIMENYGITMAIFPWLSMGVWTSSAPRFLALHRVGHPESGLWAIAEGATVGKKSWNVESDG